MSGAQVLSLDEFRRKKSANQEVNQEFDVLFRRARDLRHVGQALVSGKIAVMTWAGMHDWLQREIAEEVFRRHLFGRCVLTSISYVSDVLSSFARDGHDRTGIADHLEEYSTDENPNEVLDAANTAFIMFTLWPERRARRSVHYRKLALDYGPSLYATYAGLAHKNFGYCMAEAFEPLGEIARDRFGRA